jgi:orotidine-5'-phosphate decarboxylase
MAETQQQVIDEAVRNKLALVLDVDDLVVAQRLARDLKPYFGAAKVGLELYSAAGLDAIEMLRSMGYDVFLDLKLHDIPTTVNRAARVLGELGVSYLTMHAHGGVDMLRAGVEGLGEGSANSDVEFSHALAVTVLTSDSDAPPHIMPKRVMLAAEAGCAGIVCSVSDLTDAHSYAPRLLRVTPGIRLSGADHDDHANPSTPTDALAKGSDLLVIGRTVTQADDPIAACERIYSEIAAA